MTNEEIENQLENPNEIYLSTTWAEVNNGNLVFTFGQKTLDQLSKLGKEVEDYFVDHISSCIITKPIEGDEYEIVIGSGSSLTTVIIQQDLPLRYSSDLLKYQENSDQIGLIFKMANAKGEYSLDLKCNLILENFDIKNEKGGFRNAGE